jgi:predicted O-methyltransferase YrrM
VELRDQGAQAVTGGFDAALAAVTDVEGWMTEDQLRRLWDAAAAVRPDGQIVEIGSFRGRSAIALALAAREGATVVAIDPHAGGDRGPGEIADEPTRGERDHAAFAANVAAAGVAERVRHVRAMSHAAHAGVTGDIDLLHVDGAHRYLPARDDIADWGARVPVGGTLLIHDSFSSIGVTGAQLRLLVFSGRFRYVGRTASLAEYRREDLSGGARVRSAGRQLAQLPWFARNVAVKVLLTLRLRRAARLLGAERWPY